MSTYLSDEKNQVARCNVCGHWVRIEKTKESQYFCQCPHCKTQWPSPAAVFWNIWEAQNVYEPSLPPVTSELALLGWEKYLRSAM
jgi:hypothetical protein